MIPSKPYVSNGRVDGDQPTESALVVSFGTNGFVVCLCQRGRGDHRKRLCQPQALSTLGKEGAVSLSLAVFCLISVTLIRQPPKAWVVPRICGVRGRGVNSAAQHSTGDGELGVDK